MVKLVDALDFMSNLYNNYRLYGPYKSKQDNRLRVVLVHELTRAQKTISYPKYLVEIKLNRHLDTNDTVHHIDGNPLNNDLSNLTVLNRSQHSKLDAIKVQNVIVHCIWCEKPFLIKGHQIRQHNRRESGPFCSKLCTGKYGAYIQNGGKVLSKVKIDKVHVKERYTGDSINE